MFRPPRKLSAQGMRLPRIHIDIVLPTIVHQGISSTEYHDIRRKQRRNAEASRPPAL